MDDPKFFIHLLEIIGINIILSGDNAVVIALAARSLPGRYRRAAILLGSAAAILMRVVLTIAAAELLTLPWLRLVGGILLVWIGVRLVVPDDGSHSADDDGKNGVWQAVRTILLADLIMSLDNVLGVAAAAHGSILLLILGLVISIPLIIFGSALILKIMDRYPVVITLGAALIGYVAGEMVVADAVVAEHIPEAMRHTVGQAAAILGAGLVVGVGLWLSRRAKPREQVFDVDGDTRKR